MVRSSFSFKERWMRWSIVVLAVCFFSMHTVHAQQVNCEVKLLLERLPLEKQEKLKNFAEDIEAYINDYDWTGESLEEPIPVAIQIFMTDKSVSYEDRYSANFFISNKSDLQYYDKYWYFPYQARDQLIHSDTFFHPFTGFLDFYVYLILGNEYDKYGKLLGTPFFEKAKYISEQVGFNSVFLLGWKERTKIVEKILSEENKSFRLMKDLFFLGLTYFGEEDSTAQMYCRQALSYLDQILLSDPQNKEASQFLQGHYLELIDLFKEDQEVLQMLVRMDPRHTEMYQKYIKK